MTNNLWTFLVHTGALFLGFGTFVALAFIVVNRLVKD